jgi:cyclic dehypoxanthinyl futalosine synthase
MVELMDDVEQPPNEIAPKKGAVQGDFSLCNVGFLNSAPYRHASKLSWISYTERTPDECARLLHEGKVDAALIPLAEYANHGGYDALPMGITANGKVQSVLFVADCPLSSVQTVLLDSTSKTSVVLFKLLLEDIFGERAREIEIVRATGPDLLDSVSGYQGALVIGDRALEREGDFRCSVDLAELWCRVTGKPFVFAVWAFRPGSLTEERRKELFAALEDGVRFEEVYAREWADEHGADRDKVTNYIVESIGYQIDQGLAAGAQLFLDMAASMKLLPASSFSVGGIPSVKRTVSVRSVLQEVAEGRRLSLDEGGRIAREASFADLALAADYRRNSMQPGRDVSYLVERRINYTNICNVYCHFCDFYRAPGKEGGYVLTRDEIGRRVQEAIEAGVNQILIQGGLNPELGIDYYEDLFKWITDRHDVRLHALSSDEVWHISKVSDLSIDEVLKRLMLAGMVSLPGAGAEILVDRIRVRIARLKTSSKQWLSVHRAAHKLGMNSTCTMMFGVQETWEDRLVHLSKLRDLQDDTGGFSAFIPWPFQSEPGLDKLKASNTSALEYLKILAISRLFLDNIPRLVNSWVTMGPTVGQVALSFGANEFGAVDTEGQEVSSVGNSAAMNATAIEQHILESGFLPLKRDVHYRRV